MNVEQMKNKMAEAAKGVREGYERWKEPDYNNPGFYGVDVLGALPLIIGLSATAVVVGRAVKGYVESTSFVIVKSGEEGVKIRLGRIDPRPLGPGIHFGVPFIEHFMTVEMAPVRAKYPNVGRGNAGDGTLVTADTDVIFRVEEGGAPEFVTRVLGGRLTRRVRLGDQNNPKIAEMLGMAGSIADQELTKVWPRVAPTYHSLFKVGTLAEAQRLVGNEVRERFEGYYYSKGEERTDLALGRLAEMTDEETGKLSDDFKKKVELARETVRLRRAAGRPLLRSCVRIVDDPILSNYAVDPDLVSNVVEATTADLRARAEGTIADKLGSNYAAFRANDMAERVAKGGVRPIIVQNVGGGGNADLSALGLIAESLSGGKGGGGARGYIDRIRREMDGEGTYGEQR